MSISPARSAAFDVLIRIERERAFSSVLLPMYEERLSRADKSLCHELVLGTLRRQIPLDLEIDHLSHARRLDLEVRVALRLGLFQLHDLDRMPARAAIHESVELVKRAKKASAAGFVNALLRRTAREPFELSHANELDRIAAETSHPKWLLGRWVDRLGVEQAERLASANNEVPRVTFRVIGGPDPRIDSLVTNSVPSNDVQGCFIQEVTTNLTRELAAANKIYLQDEASQMVAHAVDVPPKGQFLDVCAAPGGKTGFIAASFPTCFGAAGDLHERRVKLLRENCLRQAVDVSVVRYDAERGLPFAGQTFNAVLVDAPCSGTGTIRHNPEIRYFLCPEDIAELSSKQRRILAEASKTVKRGGSLIYSTCSLEVEEGEQVAHSFLEENADFIAELPRVPNRFVTGQGFARTWPHRDHMDGFFIAAFRRV